MSFSLRDLPTPRALACHRLALVGKSIEHLSWKQCQALEAKPRRRLAELCRDVFGNPFHQEKPVRQYAAQIKAESEAAPPPLEPGAVWVRINQAYEVLFLYDEGNRGVLEDSPLGEIGGEIFHDRERRALEQAGLLRCFGFDSREREDPFVGQVYVGPPPDAKRITRTSAKSLQRGLLHLPTGRLRIEALTSLTIGPEEPEEQGTEITVPPGDYEAALYVRKDDKVPLLVLTPTGAKTMKGSTPTAKSRARKSGRKGQ